MASVEDTSAPASRLAHALPWGRRASTRRLAAVAFLLIALAIWQIGSTYLPPVLLPSPSRVASRFGQLISDPAMTSYTLWSFVHLVASVAISFTLGTAIALGGYFFPVFAPAIYSRMAPFLNSFSGIGWAFLGLIWFGINSGAAIFASTMALLPLTIINVGAGLRELNEEMLEMSTSFTRNDGRRTWRVILPMMFPYLFASLRLNIGIAWQIVLTIELLSGVGGLGTLINIARQRFWTDMVFAIAFLILIIVYVTDRLIFANVQNRLRKSYDV